MNRLLDRLQRTAPRLLRGGLAVLAVSFLLGLVWTGGVPAAILGWTAAAGTVVGLVGAAGILAPGRDIDGPARAVHPPVSGRWLAINSPASAVPSHGTRGYRQSHAIDLIHEPAAGSGPERPAPGVGPGMHPPQDYPAFGAPVLSMVSGTVVLVRARDHRSRSRVWSLLYLYAEDAPATSPEPAGWSANHVVVDACDGCYALVTHLQRGSALGQPVHAGQPLARCGNSGNSSSPRGCLA